MVTVSYVTSTSSSLPGDRYQDVISLDAHLEQIVVFIASIMVPLLYLRALNTLICYRNSLASHFTTQTTHFAKEMQRVRKVLDFHSVYISGQIKKIKKEIMQIY